MSAVTIRLARLEDGPAVAAIYDPIVANTVISFEAHPPGAAEMARRIEATVPVHPWLVYEGDGAVCGYAYAGPHATRDAYRWSADVSVYVAPDAHRRGIGRALYTELFAILEGQGFRQVFAGITLPNEASVGLHETLGFALVGIYRNVGWKFGAWHDVGHWQRTLGAGGETPPEPYSSPHAIRVRSGAGRADRVFVYMP